MMPTITLASAVPITPPFPPVIAVPPKTEGEIEFTVNGQRVLCKKGDFIHVEPKEASSIQKAAIP